MRDRIKTLFVLSIFLSPPILFATSFDEYQVEPNNCSSILVQPIKESSHTTLKFGERVRISGAKVKTLEAYFLGVSDEKAYFTKTKQSSILAPMFYVPIENIKIERVVREGSLEVVQLLTLPSALPEVKANAASSCEGEAAWRCLLHLQRVKALPQPALGRLNRDMYEILSQLNSEFGSRNQSGYAEVRDLQQDLKLAKTKVEQLKAEGKLRNRFMTRLANRFAELGVRSQKTTSVLLLIRHLELGLPAYISVGSGPIPIERPNITQLGLAMGHFPAASGSLPMPRFVSEYEGIHAVYAMGVLPRDSGFMGFFQGRPIAVMDSRDQSFNLWNTHFLRLSYTGQFLLLFP